MYFHGINCSNQDIEFSIYNEPDYPEIASKASLNGAEKIETSHFYFSPKQSVVVPTISNSRSSVFTLNLEDYCAFQKFIGFENIGKSDFLYALSRSSAALLDRIKMPSTAEEGEINRAMFSSEKRKLPVYNSIQILFEEGAYKKVDRNLPLIFNSSMSRKVITENGKEKLSDRDYVFKLECLQKEALYEARFELTLVPERLLRRGAVDAVVS
jgi:hypothetical protein